jgi:uncharacterized protein YoaH (UPF0181 family)
MFKRISLAVSAALAAAGAAIVNFLRPVGEAIEGYMHSNGLILSAITSSSSNSVGQSQRFDARHLDDAASPAAAVWYPGFRPKYVKVVNLTDRIQWEWYLGMAEGDAIKTVAAGTRTLDTADELVVEDDEGSRPSITLAAGVTLQNKQYTVLAEA